MSAGFIELQLDPLVSYGTKGGLVYPAIVVTNPSRIETRFPQTSRGYWDAEISFNDKTKKQMLSNISVHWGRVRGKSYGWRWRNYQEYYTCTDDRASSIVSSEPITTYAGGTTLQLMHTRWPGTAQAEIVPIRKPDMNSAGGTTGTGIVTCNLYRDGSGTPWPSASNWTLDVTTGIVTFVADQTGHTFSWLGYWDTPSRFDVEGQEKEWVDFDDIKWDGIKIMEIQV